MTAITTKKRRDIFRFNGEKPTAINLEHVTNIVVEEKRITFTFYNSAVFIDFLDKQTASSIFEKILNVWAGDNVWGEDVVE